MNRRGVSCAKSESIRLGNYDLLRILSMVAVVVLHINAAYLYKHHSVWINDVEQMVNIATRFSVPCFVMISGGFILSNLKNKDYRYFYRKSLLNTVFPFLGVLLLLLCMSVAKAIVQGENWLMPIRDALIGDFSNLWYMFMLCGLYFFVPVIIRVKESISAKAFGIVAFLWLAFAVLFQSFSSYLISYSFGIVFAYLGYFLVGNVIFEKMRKGKYAWMYFLIAALAFAAAFFVRRKFHITYYDVNPYTSFFSPLVTVASLFVFLGFSNWNLSLSFGRFPKMTFYIYLFHTAVFSRLLSVAKEHIWVNEIVTILLISLATVVISSGIGLIYEKLYDLLRQRLKNRQ